MNLKTLPEDKQWRVRKQGERICAGDYLTRNLECGWFQASASIGWLVEDGDEIVATPLEPQAESTKRPKEYIVSAICGTVFNGLEAAEDYAKTKAQSDHLKNFGVYVEVCKYSAKLTVTRTEPS